MQPGLAEFIEKHSVSGVRAYLLATIGILAATGLRVLMTPVLGDPVAPVFHSVVLVLTAAFAGLGPSLFGLALALCLTWFMVPTDDLTLTVKLANRIAVGLSGAVVCVVTSTMREALLTAARARREADFMSGEMHHRVKNLFAVIASMTTLSAREQPEAKDALTDLRERLQALANAHDVAINPADYISFPDLVHRLMAPHAAHGSRRSRLQIVGEPVNLPSDYITPLGLILNEMTTNAVKYGSLARPSGTVRVSWISRDDMLHIRWEESGAELPSPLPEPGAPGFGSLLVEASVAQLRGTIDRNLTNDGLIVRISIPFSDKAQKLFRSGAAKATQGQCNPPPPYLSALRASRLSFRRRPRIGDSRS